MRSNDPNLNCTPEDISLKSLFLGPQSENRLWLAGMVEGLLGRWFSWRRRIYPEDGSAISLADQALPAFQERRARFAASLDQLTSRFEAEMPKFSPRYVGHMFSEISLPALLGHIAALVHNPNNISAESSQVGVVVEDEAIRALAVMLGFDAGARGHFTSGGTIANFEAMLRARARCASWLALSAATDEGATFFEAAHMGWQRFESVRTASSADVLARAKELDLVEGGDPFMVASELSAAFQTPFRSPIVLVPDHRHYSWRKGVSLLGLGAEALWGVSLDDEARLNITDLRAKLAAAEHQNRAVLMVVSVAGTTELGQFDPVDQVQDLLDELAVSRGLHIWHHVDAAYGGFFATLSRVSAESSATASLESAVRAISRVDSVTLDPHKLGYVPYACGAFLTREEKDYTVKSQGAPYIQFETRDRGPYTLEGSRPATGAAATWMIAKAVGLDPDGYGRILSRTLRITQDVTRALQASNLPLRIAPNLDSNVLCFAVADDGSRLSEANRRTTALFDLLAPGKGARFTVSRTTLSADSYDLYIRRLVETWNGQADSSELTLIRMCLINPFFDAKEMDVSFTDDLVAYLTQIMSEPTHSA